MVQPVPFTVAIPAGFAIGNVSGNLLCVDGYIARVTLSPNLTIRQDSEVHLIQASLAYSQPNIGTAASAIPGFPAGDDRISIAWNGGARTDYIFPQGLYAVSDIATQLNIFANTAGWTTNPLVPLFVVQGVSATQSIILTLQPAALTGGIFPAGGVVIDFLNPSVAALNNSIGPILGWPTTGAGATLTIAGGGGTPVSFSAPNTANFALTTAYALGCSFAIGSYLSGGTGSLVSVFPLGTFAPNSVISFQPPLRFPVPTIAGAWATVDFTFYDQSGNRLLLANFQAPTSFSLLIAEATSTA